MVTQIDTGGPRPLHHATLFTTSLGITTRATFASERWGSGASELSALVKLRVEHAVDVEEDDRLHDRDPSPSSGLTVAAKLCPRGSAAATPAPTATGVPIARPNEA